MTNVQHCKDCGNPDCPKVTTEPYWKRCPAAVRLGEASITNGQAPELDSVPADAALDGPIQLPKLPKLTEAQRVAFAYMCDGNTAMPGMMRASKNREVRVLPSTLMHLQMLGLCDVRTLRLGLIAATRFPHRDASC